MGHRNRPKSGCLRMRFERAGMQRATTLASFGVLRQFLNPGPGWDLGQISRWGRRLAGIPVLGCP
jgi:hypothetical protein